MITVRSMLDPADPARLQPCFDACLDALREHGGPGASVLTLTSRGLMNLSNTVIQNKSYQSSW